jgi:RNA polymerase sigma factor (sigma-70 family)
MTESHQLLAEYVAHGSEAAFREFVARYINLVYSTALRLVDGDIQLAEDVTQTVFMHLSRNARKLSQEIMLGGWLHRDTCYVASKTMHRERRRQARERQAVFMHSCQDHSAANLEKVAPVLDEAINLLGNEDRTAILLRFFEQRDFHSVGMALGSNEDAARMRVGRALEKLRGRLARRGVASTVTVLAALGRPESQLQTDERLDEYDHIGVMARHTDAVTFETASAAGEAGRALQSTLEEAIGRWIAGDSGDGETHDAFIGRVTDAITELAATPGGTIAVTSGGVIAAYCALALGLPAERWPGLARLIVNASITKIITGHTGTNMVTFNDHAHLESDRALITYR